MNAVLRIERLGVRFGNRMALDDISLSVARGRRVALLGANGAGKSTLLRAIAGRIDAPRVSGRIEIDGAAAGSRAARCALGLIPQNLSLFRRLTARENLVAFARLNGIAAGAAHEAAEASLGAIGLALRGDEPVMQLSGGMQRRVSVACGLVHRPALLLADEPTVGIDIGHREAVEDLLQAACKRGAAVIESTHDFTRVGDRFDEVIVLEEGRIVALGAPADIVGDRAGFGHVCRIRLAAFDRAFTPAGFALEGDTLVGTLHDVAQDLGDLLADLAARGVHVVDVSVEPPGIDQLLRRLQQDDAA